MATQAEIDNWFSYHHPADERQLNAYKTLRGKARELAMEFNDSVQECSDKTAAMRQLRNAVMAMNLAIACNPGSD